MLMKQLQSNLRQLAGFLLLLAAWLTPMGAWAQLSGEADAVIDEIFYNLDASTKTAEVTFHPNRYEGDVEVPSTIEVDGVTYQVTSIGYEAFYDCPNLTSVKLPSFIETFDMYAFCDCPNLTSLNMPMGLKTIWQWAICNTGLTSIEIPWDVTEIKPQAICFNENLTTLTVSQANERYDSRENCNAIIETVTDALVICCKTTKLPSTLKAISDWGLSGCSFKTLRLPDNIEIIGYNAFESSENLESVFIPASVGDYEEALELVLGVGNSLFADCPNLTSVTVSASNKYIDSRDNCNAVIATKTNTLMSACPATVIPETVTAIGEDAYLAVPTDAVTVPSSVRTIEARAFDYCLFLKDITLSEGLEEIKNFAFRDCLALEEITLPSTLTSIGSKVFSGCENLKNVTCLAVTPPVYSGSGKMYENCPMDMMTLHVPAEALNAYKEAKGWKDFGRIVAIGDVEPRTADDEMPTVEELEGQDLTDVIIDGIYYNLDEESGSGLVEDEDGTCLVIGETTNMDAISDPTPGNFEMAEAFKGIVMLLEAGKGVLSIDVKTVGSNKLAVKIGDGKEETFKSVAKGTAKVVYDVKEPTYVYIYAVSGDEAGARRAANEENGVKIYGISLDEEAEEILMGDVNGDEKVDVTDVTAVINKILGKNPQPFNEPAADVTGEGTIDVSDVTAIINIILGKK